MKINVQGFASEMVATFATEAEARAFTGAMLDAGGVITERETRALASAFGGEVASVVPEFEALALALAEDAEMQADTAAALAMLHAML